MTNPGQGGGIGECRWLDGGLQGLLDDPEGVQLLKQFMELAWPKQARAFDFYFAVRGLRAKQEQGYSDRRCRRVVLAIDRRYIRREEHLPISVAARQSIHERLQAGDDCDASVFDCAVQEVAQFLAHRVYPSFARWWGERGGGSGFELATSSAAAAAATADVVGGGGAASAAAARNARASSVPRSRSCHSGGGGSLDLTSRNLMATVRERGAAAAFTADCAGLGRAGLALPYYVGSSLSAASLPDSLPQTASLSSDAPTTTTSDTQSLLTDTGSGSLEAARAAVASRRRRRAVAAAAAAAAVAPPQTLSSSATAACDATSNPPAFARLLSDKLQQLLLLGQAAGSTGGGDSAVTPPAAAAKAAGSQSPSQQQPLPQPSAPPARDLLNEPWARRIIGRVMQSSSSDTPEQILDRHVHEVLDQRASAPHSISDPNLLVYHHHHHHHILRGGGRSGGRGRSGSSGGIGVVGKRSGAAALGASTSCSSSAATSAAVPGSAAAAVSTAAAAMAAAPSTADSGFGGTVSSRSRFGFGDVASAAAATATSATAVPGRQLHERVALHASSQAGGMSLPRQPLASDLNMPVLDRPHTDNVIEEARRRLQMMAPPSQQTPQPPQQQPQAQLTVGYFFCGDSVPFRHDWPQPEISLAQFKRLLPKRGAYRYFFKKRSDEFEEVTADGDLLPLWEGKVVGKVERVE
ncbi:hypothetical protein BOX15_Mlig019355g1 [Macrostomum lignano]|uniref:DIX domain-containing protein n=1 Tax=Macrostomum lignano TaxID=282301 RepID=A0A267DD44_9PLAT|nr:hypothetical protein BOX15_Mlig019355g1 [Macrostomum lignano]